MSNVNGLTHSPGSSFLNGQPSSDYEVISGRPSSSLQNGFSMGVNPIRPLMTTSVTGGITSITDANLTQAVHRIQELSKENEELRDFLKENTVLMKKQYESLAEYKVKVRNANAYNKEKFEQTKVVVFNLRAEKLTLEEENSSYEVRINDLERQNKAMAEHRAINNSVVERLQNEVDSLQKKLTQVIAEKEDMVLVNKMDVPADEEMAKLTEKLDLRDKENTESREENSRLMKDFRQFKLTTDQLLSDLENTQSLKSERDQECKTLGKLNSRLSSDVQHFLKEVSTLRDENEALQLEIQNMKKSRDPEGNVSNKSDSDFSYVDVQHANKAEVGTSLKAVETMQTSSSQTTNSLATVTVPGDNLVSEGSPVDVPNQTNSNPMTDMLIQIQTERETVAELRSVLDGKNEQIQKLEQNLRCNEEMLLSKTTRLDSTPDDMTAEQAKVISDIQATTAKLGQDLAENPSNQFNSNEDINSLKSQVLTLINEVHESQAKLSAATATLDEKSTKLMELESQNATLNITLEKQREQDDNLIDSMRIALVNAEEAIRSEREQHHSTRSQFAELRVSFNQMVTDYRDLLNTFDEYRLSKKVTESTVNETVYKEEMNELKAQVVAAGEAVTFRDTQITQLKNELHHLKSEVEEIPILKAQADVYKCDFDAERRAREKQHAEKDFILQEMNNLQTRNQQLIDELESYSRNQMMEMQQKHAQKPTGRKPETNHTYTTSPAAASSKPKTPPQGQGQRGYPYPGPQMSNPPIVYPHEPMSVPDYTILDQIYGCHHCPKCGLQCPDLDSLQFHVLACLDEDIPPQEQFRM